MAERRLHGLQRVLGEASSFARHAINEFWSFFAAWGQMLNYVITIAISAFFVPHYIGGLFWPFLKTSPGDIIFGIAVVALLCGLNVIVVKEAARVNIVLALTDFATQLLLVMVGAVLVLSPATLVHNVHLGTVPSWKNLVIAIPVGMIAYTGIETISNMAEGGPRRVTDDPRGDQAGGDRRVRHLRRAADRGPVGASGPLSTATARHCSASARTGEASPAIRCSGSSSTCTWARSSPPP